MTKEELKKYKEDDKIKFIYKLPCSFYSEGYEYIIVGDDVNLIEDNVQVFNLQNWFLKIESGSLLPYVCSTLPKSGKIKEYINIYKKHNILTLRKYILNLSTLYSKEKTPYLCKELTQECLWGLQIIKEFKVNRVDIFKEKSDNFLEEFLNASDSIYKMWVETND